MTGSKRISGRLIIAARALSGVDQKSLADAAGLPLETLQLLENSGSAWIQAQTDIEAVYRGLDHFGIVVIEESDGMGAGVRLKFSRDDVRQIARLESEGGTVGSDDAP